jgi:peptide/nickel transport system substrate-binding protein
MRTSRVTRSVKTSRRWARWGARAAATLAAVLLLTACGSSAKTNNASGGTLTIAQAVPPNSLDPAKINQAFEWYINLAYDPLIFWSAQGTPQPGLATSWKYVGTGNTTFELTLRPNVKFSDGSALTAQSVKDSLEYQAKSAGQAAPYLAGKTFTVTGPLALRITAATPDPLLPRELSQDYLAGNIISPTALKNPKQLATSTAGAGPYVLDSSATVSNDHYGYKPNPNYWNKDAVHYKTVTIKVIANSNSALNALKTRQVDVVNGDYTTAAAAESAGMQVKYAPQVFVGLGLLDRDGKLSKPLADVRVRQALNYAVDRKTITTALFGKYGTPTEQTVVPGQDGAVDSQTYGYDPAKAKQLLAAAGYPNGFDLPVNTTSFFGISNVNQAMASDLTKVGVNLKLKIETVVDKYIQNMVAAKYPAIGIGYGGQPIYLEGPGLFLPSAATFNPFKSSDKDLEDLYAKAAAANDTDRKALDQQIEQRLIDEAWFVPVSLSPVFFFARPGVTGVEPSPGQPITNPVWFAPSGE